MADAKAAFIADDPWPERMLARGKPMDFLWTFDLAVSAQELWPYVMDTSRFNRAMGLNRMEFREEAGVRYGSGLNAGMRQEWIELPWDWVAGRMLAQVREYTRGLAWFVRSRYVLESLGEHRVRFHVYFGWIPRGVVGRTVIRLGFPGFEGRYRKVLAELEKHIQDRRPDSSPYRAPAPELTPDASLRVTKLGEELAARPGVSREVAMRLCEYVRTGDDMDLHRIQVRPLARNWGVDFNQLLLACLHATRIGLLSLSWDVICPHCRGVRKEAGTLGDLPTRATCEVCDIEFESDGEQAIEVTFHVHPSVREVPKLTFCSAEPATKPHIELQFALPPGTARTLPTALPVGLYRRRLRSAGGHLLLEVAANADQHEMTWRASSDDAAARLAPAPVVRLDNDSDETRTFVIEEVAWSDDALRPGELFNLQDFRDLFSEESLAAELKLSVGEQTIFFTDMIGSTRFYEKTGDAGAFKEVRRHFREVYEEVRRHHGAVVKTIGDAVMASFSSPLDALRSAAAIHQRFDGKRSDSHVRLRISINSGPCIAVNLNSSIDYFGRTVNLAAKLQALVEAGQIVFPRTMLSAPGIQAFIDEQKATLEPLELQNKALDAPVPVYRWTVT